MEKDPSNIIRKAPFTLRVDIEAEEALAACKKMEEGLKNVGKKLHFEFMDGDFLYKSEWGAGDNRGSEVKGVLNGMGLKLLKEEIPYGYNSRTHIRLYFWEIGENGRPDECFAVEVLREDGDYNLFSKLASLETKERYSEEKFEAEKFEVLSNLFNELEAVAMPKPSQDDIEEPPF